MNSESKHYSVLLSECIEGLNIKPNGIYVDGTTGLGGHSLQIAARLNENGRLICIDRDENALNYSSHRLDQYRDNITFVHANFCDVCQVLDSLGYDKVDGMIFDLGVSSPQLDDADRGFSYMQDAQLDMRMDRSKGLTASDIVNSYSEKDISKILWEYGEERYSGRIARAIVNYRNNKRVETTLELVGIITSAMPGKALREKQHPAKRSFQAIRIAVNDELGSIEKMMEKAPDYLNSGGRICVISFHSLEDRIVKIKAGKRENGCVCPREAPICTCGFSQTLKAVSRKPILPSEKELEENPRSRSAKLRVYERL